MATYKKDNITVGAEDDWVYEYISQYIKSPPFRTPIKDFVDENCNTFFSEGENSFQQSALHNEFKLLIENLLEKMLEEVGASQEQFLLAARKGLENGEDQKYFEQLIACDNYLYFKNMMIKRNLQLEEQAFQLMKGGNTVIDKPNAKVTNPTEKKETPVASNKEKKSSLVKNVNSTPKEQFELDPEWQELKKLREKAEMDCAIQMSLALEEEKKRLMAIEEDELRKAIEMSKSMVNTKKEEELSLFNPSTLTTKKDLTSSNGANPAPLFVPANNNKQFTNTNYVSMTGGMDIISTSENKTQTPKNIPCISSNLNTFSIKGNEKVEKVNNSQSKITPTYTNQNNFQITNNKPINVNKTETILTTTSTNNQWKIDDHLGKDNLTSTIYSTINTQKEYIDKTIEKSEKLEFGNTDNDNLLNLGKQVEKKPKNNTINIDKTSVNEMFEVSPNTSANTNSNNQNNYQKVILQTDLQTENPINVSKNLVSADNPKMTNPIPVKTIEGVNIDDNVDFNNQFNLLANISNNDKQIKPVSLSSNNTNNAITEELTVEDFINNNNENLVKKKTQLNNNNFMSMSVNNSNTNHNKLNLGQIKTKKALDSAFGLDSNRDSGFNTQYKSMIDTKSNIELIPNSALELAKKYEEIEKDKQNQLKDYRDIILKMKKDKRSDQKEKEKEKESDLFEEEDPRLSEEVKKRIQMRKLLADKLKK